MVMQPIKYAQYNFPCWPHLQDFLSVACLKLNMAKSYILPL